MAGVASRYGLLDDLKGSNRSRRPEVVVHELDEPSTVAFRQPTKEEADWYAVGRDGHCVAVVDERFDLPYDDYHGYPDYSYEDDYGRGEHYDQRVADHYEDESYYADRSWLVDLESSHAWWHAKSDFASCGDDSCELTRHYDSYDGPESEFYDYDEDLSTWAEIALDRERLDAQSPRHWSPSSRYNLAPEAPVSEHEAARQAARFKRTERLRRDRRMVHGRLRSRQDHASGVYCAPRWKQRARQVLTGIGADLELLWNARHYFDYYGQYDDACMELRDPWTDQNRLRGPRRQELEVIRFERELDLEPTLPMGKVKPKPESESESETEEAPPEEPKLELSHFTDPWGDEVFEEPLGNQMVRSMGVYPITFDGEHPDWDIEPSALTSDDTWGIPPEDAVILCEELDDYDLLDRPEWPQAVIGSTAKPYLDTAHRVAPHIGRRS